MAWAYEKPQRSIDVAYDFWISKYPITNAQFSKFREQNKLKTNKH